MAETTPHAFYAVESWSSWIWRKLGFGECRAPRDEADEYAEGYAPSWFITETRIRFNWTDRLRVLVSGKVMVQQAIKTDAVINRARSTGAVSVMRPRAYFPGREVV